MSTLPTPKRAKPQWLALLGLLGAFGCIPPGAQQIVGPDGTAMLHVHCGNEQNECFRVAGESCPFGYDYAPVSDARDGNFLVRCRQPIAALPQPALPPTPAPSPPGYFAAPSSPAPVISPHDPGDWPPAEVGKPTEPWSQDAAATSGLPPTPRTKLGEVDIGY